MQKYKLKDVDHVQKLCGNYAEPIQMWPPK